MLRGMPSTTSQQTARRWTQRDGSDVVIPPNVTRPRPSSPLQIHVREAQTEDALEGQPP